MRRHWSRGPRSLRLPPNRSAAPAQPAAHWTERWKRERDEADEALQLRLAVLPSPIVMEGRSSSERKAERPPARRRKPPGSTGRVGEG